jgi:hypothetical protein
MAEAKITIGGRALSERQAEIVRIAVDRWSYDENIDVGSEDHDRVRELKSIIDNAREGPPERLSAR